MKKEASRIQKELDNLDSEFTENGIVKTVLRQRIKQELLKQSLIDDQRRKLCQRKKS